MFSLRQRQLPQDIAAPLLALALARSLLTSSLEPTAAASATATAAARRRERALKRPALEQAAAAAQSHEHVPSASSLAPPSRHLAPELAWEEEELLRSRHFWIY